MWSDKNLLDIIKMFLPSTSKIILFKTPYKRPAVELIDLDGDNILELVGAYYWKGEIYIIILKYYGGAWHVLDNVKGKGYNITYFNVAPIASKYKNNLAVSWQVGAIWSDEVLTFEYPYPSREKLRQLKKQIYEEEKYGIELRNSNLTNQAIIDVKVGNILGEYTHDKVILVGSYIYKDSPYVENVDIVINPEEGGSPIITKIPYVGYNLELFLGDFNGDEKDEIMVRGAYGGSDGYAIAAIYEYRNRHLVEIFNPDMFSEKYKFIAKYLEEYKVLVQSVTLKEKYIFGISKTPKIYLNMIYDENGKAKGGEKPTISTINGAFPIKIVFEKNYYLFIRQRVVGVSNADKIGYIESFVDLSNNNIKVVEMGAYQLGEKKSARI